MADLFRFLIGLRYAASRDKSERDQFHEVVLHGETLVFSPLRPLRAVAEVESGSTFRETCLATEVRKFQETDHVTRCNAC